MCAFSNSPADSAWVPCEYPNFRPMTHRRFPGRGSARNIPPSLARSQSIARTRNNRSSTRRGGSSHTTRRHQRKCRSRPSRAEPGRQRDWFAWFSPWQTEQRCPPLYSNRTSADLPSGIGNPKAAGCRHTSRANGLS